MHLHFDEDEDDVNGRPGNPPSAPSGQRRLSPGVRRGGRLGSPGSPAGGGVRSLWGWADAPPSGGGGGSRGRASGGKQSSSSALLEEGRDGSSDDEDGGDVPLSELLRSLHGK